MSKLYTYYVVKHDFRVCDPFSSVSPGANTLIPKGTLVKRVQNTSNFIKIVSNQVYLSTKEDLERNLEPIDSKYVDLLYNT